MCSRDKGCSNVATCNFGSDFNFANNHSKNKSTSKNGNPSPLQQLSCAWNWFLYEFLISAVGLHQLDSFHHFEKTQSRKMITIVFCPAITKNHGLRNEEYRELKYHK